MNKPLQISEQAVASMLKRISKAGRKQRLSDNTSQTDQAEMASISVKALQKIEAGEGGNSSVLFKYLHSLNLLNLLYSALPDPAELTPIEKLAIQSKNSKVRATAKSIQIQAAPTHKPKPAQTMHKWGDEK